MREFTMRFYNRQDILMVSFIVRTDSFVGALGDFGTMEKFLKARHNPEHVGRVDIVEAK